MTECNHENTSVRGCVKCHDCGDVPELDVRAVSNDDLRELIEQWKEEYGEYDNDPSKIPNGGHQMMCRQINECADQLERLIHTDKEI